LTLPPSAQRRLTAAVLGTGGISKEHLGFLAASRDIDLVGVCDRSPAALRHAAETYSTTGFATFGEMLDQAQPDVVHVLTPPATHSALSAEALEAGSHVICEKPITATAAELQDLLAVARRCDRVLTENHNYRFNPEVEALVALTGDGPLGDVVEVEVRIHLPVTDPAGRFGDPNLPSPIHDLPAGVVHDFITHFTYLVNYLSGGARWERVASEWSAHCGAAHIPVDDLDAILVGSAPWGPVHGRIRFSALASPDEFEVTVRGANGYAQAELFSGRWVENRPRRVGDQLNSIANLMIGGVNQFLGGPRSFARKIMQAGPYAGLNRFLEETYRSLANETPVPVGPEEMLAASELIDRLVAGRRESASDLTETTREGQR